MERYLPLFENKDHIISLFKNYFLNEENFGNRMKKTVNVYIQKGVIIENKNIKYVPIGKKQDCEENSYKFAKKNNMQVVDGFVHTSDEDDDDDNYWVAHFWVYDFKNNKHIEVTPGIDGSIGRIGRIVKKELLNKPLNRWGILKNSDYM